MSWMKDLIRNFTNPYYLVVDFSLRVLDQFPKRVCCSRNTIVLFGKIIKTQVMIVGDESC